MAQVLTVPQRIRPHDGPNTCLLHTFLKRWQVDFAQSTFTHVYIYGKAVCFLVVQRKVFKAASHAVGLRPLDVRHGHFACQVGVFAHILKATAVKRHATDVGSRPQNDVFAPESKLFAYGVAVFACQIAVPCGGQTG